MKPIELFTVSQFLEAKTRQKLPMKCNHCTKTFYLTKWSIHDNRRQQKKDGVERGLFCSKQCFNKNWSESRRTRCLCSLCGKAFSRTASALNNHRLKSPHTFCSQSCAATYNNTHKNKGTRVSKLEKWLANQLPRLYPTLEFHFNRKDTINSELDIYIPSLKLAFELNGIFHYEPIYGTDKLSQTQNNDQRKFQACLERGLELCIIDTSNLLYFKEANAQKYLNIVSNVIERKLTTHSSSSPASHTCCPVDATWRRTICQPGIGEI